MDGATNREKEFHSAVREYIISLLLFIGLYCLSYTVIRAFKKRSDHDDLYAGDAEDYQVYRISVWICTFSLAVSIAAVFLLPCSILSNEILRLYPNSYYIQWLNSSLVHSLWNYVFLLSNLCLFIFLPFSYFFLESQGFIGLKKGIMTRVYESLAVCMLLIVVVFCLAHLISILLDHPRSRKESLFKIWNYQLPFVYSCVSSFGVITLLTCTPLGFARMFSLVGDLVVKPKLKRDLDVELLAAKLEKETLERKINGFSNGIASSPYHQLPCNGFQESRNGSWRSNGESRIRDKLAELTHLRAELERQKKGMRWLQNLKYPLVMLILVFLTGLSALMVGSNTFQLLVGFRSLPPYRQYMELGNISLSALGLFGATLEIIIIFYVMLASLVGLYGLPGLRKLRPVRNQTSMTKVIGNCTAVLILSSALPVLARTLGITTFDLLGAYGKLDWLRNFYLVWSYNVVFAVATGLCLVTKFTSTVRAEVYKRLSEAGNRLRNRGMRGSESSLDVSSLSTSVGSAGHNKTE